MLIFVFRLISSWRLNSNGYMLFALMNCIYMRVIFKFINKAIRIHTTMIKAEPDQPFFPNWLKRRLDRIHGQQHGLCAPQDIRNVTGTALNLFKDTFLRFLKYQVYFKFSNKHFRNWIQQNVVMTLLLIKIYIGQHKQITKSSSSFPSSSLWYMTAVAIQNAKSTNRS